VLCLDDESRALLFDWTQQRHILHLHMPTSMQLSYGSTTTFFLMLNLSTLVFTTRFSTKLFQKFLEGKYKK